MADCSVCKRIAENNNVICKNGQFAVLVPDAPALPGHIWIVPLQHYAILEQVPAPIVRDLFSTANMASIACIEATRGTGTNIMMQNGIPAGQSLPHVVLQVLARTETDGLPFSWNPQTVPEETFAQLQQSIAQEAKNIQEQSQAPPPKKEEPVKREPPKDTSYLLHALRRTA